MKMTAAAPATAVAKSGAREILIQTRHTFVALWRNEMYRIHFTANGALRTERAVLEISPAGIRWRFKPGEGIDNAGGPQASVITATTADGAAISRQSTPSAHGNSLVIRDYAHRWPVYQRRRMARRWKAELVLMATLMTNDLRERFEAAVLRLIAAVGPKVVEPAANGAAAVTPTDLAPSPSLTTPAFVEEST